MYPLVEWGHNGISSRLRRLNKNELFYESVVASAQTLEQIIKRILRNELASKGMKIEKERIDDGSNKFALTVSTCLADIDKSLAMHCQSINTLQKKPWNLAMNAPRLNPTLSELITITTSQNDWECIVGAKKIEPCRLPDSILNTYKASSGQPASIRCGLIAMRHQIVHQPNAPDLATVRALAYFGESLISRILCPKNGIASRGIRDPLKRCSRFRSRLND